MNVLLLLLLINMETARCVFEMEGRSSVHSYGGMLLMLAAQSRILNFRWSSRCQISLCLFLAFADNDARLSPNLPMSELVITRMAGP